MTLCSYLTNEMIDKIILKAYLQSMKLRHDADLPTPEMLFEQENNWVRNEMQEPFSQLNPLMTNGFTNHYHLGESTLILGASGVILKFYYIF